MLRLGPNSSPSRTPRSRRLRSNFPPDVLGHDRKSPSSPASPCCSSAPTSCRSSRAASARPRKNSWSAKPRPMSPPRRRAKSARTPKPPQLERHACHDGDRRQANDRARSATAARSPTTAPPHALRAAREHACRTSARRRRDGPTEWDQKEMPFTEHLRELRKRLIISRWHGAGDRRARALARPAADPDHHAAPTSRDHAQRVRPRRRRRGRSSSLRIYIAIVLGLPVILYQTWMFVVPADPSEDAQDGVLRTSRRRFCSPRPASRSRTFSCCRASSARCSRITRPSRRRCSASSRRSISCSCCSSPSH